MGYRLALLAWQMVRALSRKSFDDAAGSGLTVATDNGTSLGVEEPFVNEFLNAVFEP